MATAVAGAGFKGKLLDGLSKYCGYASRISI